MPAPAPVTLASPASSPTSSPPAGRKVWVAALLLVVAIALAYANSLRGPFVYDDADSISFNRSIRRLWPLTDVLRPPGDGATVSGRPILNLSFAINYALHRLDVRGYHLANVLVHAAATLALFGVLRRTLARSRLRERLGDAVTPTAMAVAATWALHPLQTEAVTYVVQRAESLMALWYLLTLYAFIRSLDSPVPLRWRIAAWVACLLGMGTKENMVSAPVLVLLYDRAFVSGSLAAAWRARWRFYLSLAATWVVLGALVVSTGGNRGGSAGVDVGVHFGSYWLTQVPALARYAALSLWPHPLVFDYGAFVVRPDAWFAVQAVVVLTAIVALLWALWRHPQAGWPGAVALAVLAPTSLVPGTTQMIVEHRMYLPLAAVLCVGIGLGCVAPRRLLAIAAALVIVSLGVTTAARNRVYRTSLALWSDTVAKRPDSAVAHGSYGAALREAGKNEVAVVEHRRALEIDPNYTPALGNLGMYLTDTGHPVEALAVMQRAIQLQPRGALGHLYAGRALNLLGRPEEALARIAEAARLNPLLPVARYDYGDVLARAGRLEDAVREFKATLEIDPANSDAYMNLAGIYVRLGDLAAAREAFAEAARRRPDDGETHLSWANFLLMQGRPQEALVPIAHALERQPNSAFAHYSHGMVLAALEQFDGAIAEFETAVRLDPGYAEAYNNLGNVLASANRLEEAVTRYRRSLELRPNHAVTENNLGLALARLGRIREAREHFEAAVRIDPALVNARENLTRAETQLRAGADAAGR